MSMSNFSVFWSHYQHEREGGGSETYAYLLQKKAEKYGNEWIELWNIFCEENSELISIIFASSRFFDHELDPYFQAIQIGEEDKKIVPPYTFEQIIVERLPESVAWSNQMEARIKELSYQHFGLLAQAAMKMQEMGIKYDYENLFLDRSFKREEVA